MSHSDFSYQRAVTATAVAIGANLGVQYDAAGLVFINGATNDPFAGVTTQAFAVSERANICAHGVCEGQSGAALTKGTHVALMCTAAGQMIAFAAGAGIVLCAYYLTDNADQPAVGGAGVIVPIFVLGHIVAGA